jgi:hypothetical protein
MATNTRSKQWAGRLAGILFGLVMAWLLLEVLLRVMFFSLPPRLQLVMDDVRITPFTDRKLMPDPIWQPDTEYLTIARPVQNRDQYGSADVHFTVSTESLWGSRAAFRTQQTLVDRHVDAVAVGDSFTFCFTEENDCWVQRLGTITNRNIINLGIVSTGSVSHRHVLANFGMPLQPPLVIWQWWGNDFNEDYGLAKLNHETQVEPANPPPAAPELNWWDEHSAVYVLLKTLFGKADEASLQFWDREHVSEGDLNLSFGRSYLWGAFDLSLPQNQDGWQRSQQAILESRDMVEAYGGTFVIVLIPTKEQVYRDLAEPLIGEEHMALLDDNYAHMVAFCEAQNLTCLDMLPVFEQEDEQLYYTTDIHLNPHGNEVLADYLSDWMADQPELFTDAGS